MSDTPMYLPNGATRVLICVDDAACGEPRGRWYNPYCDGPTAFAGVIPLLSSLERMYNRLTFPQSAFALRSLHTRKAAQPKEKKRNEVRRYMGDEMFEQERGEKATFIVQVQFRQNATWQGTVTWAEKNETCHFRSALELLKMMDEAMNEAAPEQESLA